MELNKSEDPLVPSEPHKTGDDGDNPLSSSSDWNYEKDLDFLKHRLSISSLNKTKERKSIRNLIAICTRITQSFEQEPEVKASHARFGQQIEESTIEKAVANRKNPLLIDLIFNEVLSYLPVRDLLQFRFVDRTWNEKATPWISKKKTKIVTVKAENLQEFVEVFENSVVLPFQQLHVDFTGLNVEQCSSLNTRFFTKHGGKIKAFQIETCPKRKSKESRIFLSARNDTWLLEEAVIANLRSIFSYVPNLTGLSIHFRSPGIMDPPVQFAPKELPSFTLPHMECLELSSGFSLGYGLLEALFAMVPNVRTLQLGANYDDFQDWKAFVLAAKNLSIHTILQNGSRRSTNTNPARLWTALAAEDSPRLTELSVRLGDKSHNSEAVIQSLQQLLVANSESLEILTLNIKNHYDQDPAQQLQFPVLKNLKTLTIQSDFRTSYYNEDVPYLFSPFEPVQVPKLRSVCIAARPSQGGVFAKDSVFTSVHEIRLEEWYPDERSRNTLHTIAALFPNLRKISNFETTLRADFIHTIVTGLPRIEELEIYIVGGRAEEDLKSFNMIFSGFPVGSESILVQLGTSLGFESLLSLLDPPGHYVFET